MIYSKKREKRKHHSGQDRLSVLKSNTMIINHPIKNGLRSIGNPIYVQIIWSRFNYKGI